MIRVADFVAQYLADHGVRHVFMLTGGGAMHLNDAFGLEKRIQVICNHHEQACAMASEGYARISGQPGVVCVTSGPGGTNALTGVLGEWLDSIPALYISGQVRYQNTVASTGLPLRQFGDQEASIIEIVKPITKYAAMVIDPATIRYHLEKALYIAMHGRKGPVWLDIPLDVQASQVEPEKLIPYSPSEDHSKISESSLHEQIELVVQKLISSERPLILGGTGIRLASAEQDFIKLVEQMNIPAQVAWNAIDLLPSDHPLYAGRPSTLGQRAANFIFQNCDLLISIGCRLNLRQIGYNFPSIARGAYKVSVDIDENELKKPSIKIDLPVHADAKIFIELFIQALAKVSIPSKKPWLAWCKERINRYPPVLLEFYNQPSLVNPYVFCEVLSSCLEKGDAIISSNGSSCVIPIQVMRIQKGQRHIVNSGCAAMGYGLPAAIGACLAREKGRTICLEGDGSIQLNIQEFQTIVHHQLPIKCFIFNNQGYLSIRSTQKNFFNGNFIGESKQSGVSFPDMVLLARAYGIESERIADHEQLKKRLPVILSKPGPFICDVMMDPEQMFSPRVSSKRLPDGRMVSSPLEDMTPFLEAEEFLSNMIIPMWEPDKEKGDKK
jgi:acetolactate synthase-1/2/3 large subunit